MTVDAQGPTFLILSGSGTFHLAGFDPTPGTFVFTANQSGPTFSFSASEGVCKGALGDFVWNDLNHDGIQDVGEPGIPNITVQLWNAGHTVLLGAAITDADGLYRFNALCGNTYQVEVPTSQPGLLNWLASPTFVGGNPNVDSNGNPLSNAPVEDQSHSTCFLCLNSHGPAGFVPSEQVALLVQTVSKQEPRPVYPAVSPRAPHTSYVSRAPPFAFA